LPTSPSTPQSSVIQRKVAIAACFGTFLEWYDFLTFASLATYFSTLFFPQAAYRQLFKHHIPESSVVEIREATNKAWVLGNDRFKQRIKKKEIGAASRAGSQGRG